MTGKKPAKEFRKGDVSLAIWENHREDQDGEKFTTWDVKITRKYKDKKGGWQETGYFRDRDLPVIGLLTGKAWDWIAFGDKQ